MPKFKLKWWERNWWEAEVEAVDAETAKAMFDEEVVMETAQESEDGFIDRSDIEVEEIPE